MSTAGARSLQADLEERLGLGKPRQAMPAEAAEGDAGRRSADGGLRVARHDDLSPASRGADPRRGVHGEADVADVGQCRAPAVNPDPHPYLEILGPRALTERLPNSRRRLHGRGGPLEDREELVGARVDLAPRAPQDRGP